ncbi:hypothetical protein [Allokutzneria albata]|uniref:Peptidase inhibitor family I36 n=1 Tax=Allokutzneria albata TaxID=211114 RepID=A0A1G9V6L3_ALLAB|nr:hypothetical protein [Allokutzneria albata]SDM67789.1 hypothetical protein SAMN04489726_2861 [Allokutzneria albata]
MRLVHLALTVVAAAFVVAPTRAEAAPAYLCPHYSELIPANKFPLTWNLGSSKNYKDGARTCSWQHKGTITYRCEGVLNRTTVINVVGAFAGRNTFAADCRGKEHTISSGAAYKGLRGAVHIHWHTGGAGQYTKGMLRVGS